MDSINLIRQMGFDSDDEFHKLVANVDISTPNKLLNFKKWQSEDGSKEGLLKLSSIEIETLENSKSKEQTFCKGINLDELYEVNKLLNKCTNLYGFIEQDIKDRIINYLLNPNIKNWEDIYSICIKGFLYTIWRAVRNVDISFQSTVKEGVGWESIPSPQTVIDGIKFAINNSET